MKKIITIILTIITSCILILLVYFSTLSKTILRKEYINSTIKNNNYINKVYESINKELENYIPQLHIGEEDISLNNIITKEMIKKDINSLVEYIYNNKPLKTNTEELKKKLDIKINTELNKYNRIPTKEEEKTIEEIKNNIIEDYKNRTIFSEKYIKPLNKYYKKINKIANIMIVIFALLTTLNFILLIRINRKEKEYLKWISIALLTTSITLIIAKHLTIARINHILILNENISKIIILTIKDILNKISIVSIIFGIISIIIIIIKVKEENQKEVILNNEKNTSHYKYSD